jgi:putative SOS response-associated peptidase YedK
VSAQSAERIAEYFGASFDPANAALPANFNVAPTNDVYGIVAAPDGPKLTTFHWGLVPSWAKDVKIGSKMINARAETINEKSAFKGLFVKHRLIVPMDGFYEWQQRAAEAGAKPLKQPMFIHTASGEPLAVAGLWAAWRPRDSDDPEAPWLHSCTIITTSANSTMAPVHDRMPVILPQSRWAEWLDPNNRDAEALLRLLVPADDELLTMHAVSTDVNNVRNKGDYLVEPIVVDQLGTQPDDSAS